MAMIPLAEYARRLGKPRNSVYHKYQNGYLKTAVKMGRDIWVDENEPYIDGRVKTGKYIGFRYGYQYQKQRREAKERAEREAREAAGQPTEPEGEK